MLKLLVILFLTLFIQACQVQEKVTGANQTAPSFFPGAQLSTMLPAGGWKKLGDNIDIALTFPLPVNVVGVPYIKAQIGSATRRFYFESGDDSTILIFRYTVTSSDLDSNGIAFYSTVELNGGSLSYNSQAETTESVPLNLTLPSHMTYPEKMIKASTDSDCMVITPDPLCSVKDQPFPEQMVKVDGIVPYLTQISAPAAGNYSTNQHLKYELSFSELVLVGGSPSFNIALSSGTVPASYRSGSGSKKLEFSRLLQVADADADGFSSGSSLNLSSVSGITIRDQAGNTISSSISTTASTSVLINVIQPTILSIAPVSAPGTYTLGQTVDFLITTSEAVNITGTPSIPIVLNTGTVLATYLSGTGTTSLIFRYTIQTNHVDNNGITLISPLLLNGGSIKNLAGTQNASLIYTIPSTVAFLVDAATGPYVVSIASATNGMYLETQNIDFTLNFNSIVNYVPGTGIAKIPIIVGSSTVYAEYESGTGTNAINFRYTPVAGQEDLDGISLSSPIQLTGTATIQDAGLKPAILNYLAPSTTGILVDGTTPSILSVITTSTGTLKQGQYLYLKAQFSESVTISGAPPTLAITVGATNTTANYYSGNGTSTFIFRYNVLPGDLDADGVGITSLAGTLLDPRGHTASLVFAPQTTSGVIIDAMASTMISFTPQIDAIYKIGDTLDFVVDWSEPTFISGNPKLALTVGITTQYATYVASASSPTSFVFRYTVETGHSAPLGISTSGITLSGGLIRDASGNDADLSYVYPSLAGIIVDGVVPFVNLIAHPANGTYKSGQNLNFTLTFSEDMVMPADAVINLVIGTTPVTATYISASAMNIYNFRYTVQSGQLDPNGITMLSALATTLGGVVKDIAGNSAYLQLNLPISAMNLSGVKVDAIVPTISAVLPPADDTYKMLQNIDFNVVWSEDVIINTGGGSPRIALKIDSEWPTIKYATYEPSLSTSTNSVFRYTVANLDEDTDGISIVAASVELNGSTIQDAATNDATLTFTSPVLTGVLVDGVKATIHPTNPITPPISKTYKAGDNLDFTVNWTENVDVDETGGTPTIRFWIGSTIYFAEYESGSGTPNLVFRHTILAGEVDADGVYVFSPVYLNSGTIKDAALNDAYLTFPPGYKHYPTILVDGVAPTILSSTSTNITAASKPNYFKPGQTIQYNMTFNEVVKRTGGAGTPRLELDIGGVTKYANYFSGDNSNILTFRYTIDAGDVLLDLDGISVNPTLDQSLGTIQDAAGNIFAGAVPFYETDYVYYTSTLARYHVKGSDYDAASCGGVDLCVTKLDDITGNGLDLYPAAGNFGPKIANNFGTNLTDALNFNTTTASLLRNTAILSSVKYVIFVMKTVPNPSTTTTVSNHTFLSRRYLSGGSHWSSTNTGGCTYYYTGTWLCPNYSISQTIKFTADSSTKSILMNPTQKFKMNGGTFSPSHVSSESAPTLWVASTNYIMAFELSAVAGFDAGSFIGGSEFKGQVAEIIFLSGTPAITETGHIDKIRDQLNTIHGVY